MLITDRFFVSISCTKRSVVLNCFLEPTWARIEVLVEQKYPKRVLGYDFWYRPEWSFHTNRATDRISADAIPDLANSAPKEVWRNRIKDFEFSEALWATGRTPRCVFGFVHGSGYNKSERQPPTRTRSELHTALMRVEISISFIFDGRALETLF